MTAIVKVFDRKDNFLTILENAQLGRRSWAINKIGDLDFRLPRNDPKATEENLGSLNLVTVESDTGLTTWGGQIQEVSWEEPGYVYCKAKTKETLLKRHVIEDWSTGKGVRRSSGTIIQTILQLELNDSGGIPGIYVGNVDVGGETFEYTAHGIDLWDGVVQDVLTILDDQRKEAYVWVNSDGAFNWALERGEDKSDTIVIYQGKHLTRYPKYRIDYSKLITQAIGYSNQAEWSQKYKMPMRNNPAWNKWGTLEGTITANLGTSADTAEKFARMLIRANYAPYETFDFTINNKGGIWSQFQLGDTIRAVLPMCGWRERGGFDGKIRITGLEVVEGKEHLRLIGEVVVDPAAEDWSTF